MRFRTLMINVIIFLIIFNDVEFPLLGISVLLPGAAHPVLGGLPLALGSPVLEPDLHLEHGARYYSLLCVCTQKFISQSLWVRGREA